jgi:hypothetical protein
MDRRRVIGSEVENVSDQHRDILGGGERVSCGRRPVHASELEQFREAQRSDSSGTNAV